jgi:threonylcarbamoyladenosine tRNA methylthiotransferase MtaB
MGRRYATADYARVVERVRAAIPGVAIHADVIAGFPSEDDDAFGRTRAFLRALDPAGLHVFRYSARPGTPAVRMAGQVPDATRKERAAVLLDDAAAARRRFAARAEGRRRTVLFEEPADPRDPGTGWVGHAEDYVVVRAEAPGGRPIAGEIGIVEVHGTDPTDPERAIGRIVRVVAGPAAGRALPVVPLPA